MTLLQKKKSSYSNKFLFIDVGNTFTKIFFIDYSFFINKIIKKLNNFKDILVDNKLNISEKNSFCQFFIWEIINILNIKNNRNNPHFLLLKIFNNDLINDRIDRVNLEKIIKKIKCDKINIYFLDVNKEIFNELKKFLDEKIFCLNSIECNYIPLNYSNLEKKISFSYSPLNSFGIDRVASILYYYYLSKYFFNIEFNFSLILNSGTAMVIDEIEDKNFINGSISLSFSSEIKALNLLTSRLPDLQENLNLSYEKIFEFFIDFNLRRIIKIINNKNIDNEDLILKFDKVDDFILYDFFNLFNKEIILSEKEFFNIFNYSIFNKNTINSIIYGTLNGFLFKLISLLLLRIKKNYDKKIFLFSGKNFNIKTFFVILLGIINLDFSFFKRKEILLISFNDNFFIKLKVNVIKYDTKFKIYIKRIIKSSIFSKKNIINKKFIMNLKKIKNKENNLIFLLDSDISIKGLVFEIIFNSFFQN